MSIIRYDWGPVQTTVSYRLLMEDPSFPNLVALDCGFGVGQPEYETNDAVKRSYYCYSARAGRLVPKTEVLYGATIREIRYPIALPKGKTLRSPIHEFAGRNCPRDLFMLYICPPDPTHTHFIRMPDGRFDQIQRGTAFIEADGEQAGTTYEASSTLTVTNEMTYYYLMVTKPQDTVDVYAAITWAFGACVNCSAFEHRIGYYGGLNNFKKTTDAFASGSTITTGLANTASINSVVSDGATVVAVYSDSPAGGILLSVDNGASFVDVSPASCKPLNDVIRAGSYYYAVGGTGSIYRSVDGANWTVVSNTVAAAATLYDLAYDQSTGLIYVAGDNAGTGVALQINSSGAITDISAAVKGSAGSLPIVYVVDVLADGHIAFGGAAGFFSEFATAQVSSLYRNTTVGSAAIKFIGGDPWQTVLGGGTKVWHRWVVNEMSWEQIPLAPGITITGAITSGSEGANDEGSNYFNLVTDAGEILIVAPVFPNAI